MQKFASQSVFLFIILIFLWSCNSPRKSEQVVHRIIPQDSGTLVLKTGTGNQLYQKFRITGDSIYSRIVSAADQALLAESKGYLSPDGTIDSICIKTFLPSESGKWVPGIDMTVWKRNDSVFVATGGNRYVAGNGLDGRNFEIRYNNILCFTPLPEAGFSGLSYSDSSAAGQIHIPYPVILNINSSKRDTFPNILNTGNRIVLFVNSGGKLDSLKGEKDLFGYSGIVYRKFNFDSVRLAYARRKSVHENPSATRIDTIVFENGSLIVKIKYERAKSDGNKIFGNRVPYNKVWITGVDTAAEFSVNQPVTFYGQQLRKGKYSLLTIPRQDFWLLILNSDTGLSSGDYNPDNDIFRVPMKVDSLAEEVKYLTIGVKPFETGGALTIKWENTGAVVMFK